MHNSQPSLALEGDGENSIRWTCGGGKWGMIFSHYTPYPTLTSPLCSSPSSWGGGGQSPLSHEGWGQGRGKTMGEIKWYFPIVTPTQQGGGLWENCPHYLPHTLIVGFPLSLSHPHYGVGWGKIGFSPKSKTQNPKISQTINMILFKFAILKKMEELQKTYMWIWGIWWNPTNPPSLIMFNAPIFSFSSTILYLTPSCENEMRGPPFSL